MPELNKPVDLEEKRETGTAWMVIGGICWMVAFIAMFFHLAAWKLGKLTFVEYAGGLVIIGLIVFLIGWGIRHRASE
jgi:hypothetical protein